MWRTTKRAAGRSLGRARVTATRASTPPAEAPIVMISWFPIEPPSRRHKAFTSLRHPGRDGFSAGKARRRARSYAAVRGARQRPEEHIHAGGLLQRREGPQPLGRGLELLG